MPEIPDQPDNRKRSKAEEQQPGFCWAVVFSNYEPAEIDMLFATKALAEERADQLGGDWQAERWAIQGWNVDQDREAAYRAGREDAARDVLAALRRREDGAQETYARRQALGIGDQAAEWAVRSRAWRQARQAAEEAVIARRDDERRASEAGRRAGGEDAARRPGDLLAALVRMRDSWWERPGWTDAADTLDVLIDAFTEAGPGQGDQPRTILPGEVQDDPEAQQ